jgi:hypothetical protein
MDAGGGALNTDLPFVACPLFGRTKIESIVAHSAQPNLWKALKVGVFSIIWNPALERACPEPDEPSRRFDTLSRALLKTDLLLACAFLTAYLPPV